MKKVKLLQKWMSIPAAALLLLPGSEIVSGIAVAANSPGQTQQVTSLRIDVIEGEEGVNIIKEKTAVQPVVEVRDQNNLPVAGAMVTFTLPTSGASGTFVSGSNVATAVTDATGRASVLLRPNNIGGNFRISVNASYQGQTATSTITQTNVMSSSTESSMKTSPHARAITIGVIAGLAVVGAVVLGVHASGSSGNSQASIAPGAATVGAPH